jgi:hypothetical protein
MIFGCLENLGSSQNDIAFVYLQEDLINGLINISSGPYYIR